MANGSEAAVHQFAAELTDLRVSAGTPSYRSLERLARLQGGLPRSTAAEAVAGRRLPSLPTTMAFVAACIAYAAEQSVPLTREAQDVGRWQQRWIEAKRKIDRSRPEEAADASDKAEPREPEDSGAWTQDESPSIATGSRQATFGLDPSENMFRLPDRSRSWAVVMGTGHYESPDLHDVPSAYASAVAMAEHLTDPRYGGFDKNRCTTLLDAADIASVGHELLDVTSSRQYDVLLFYYVGHSLIDADGSLYLTLPGSDIRSPYFSAVSFGRLAEELGRAAARHVVIILDCNFAGRGFRENAIMSDSYLLGATSGNRAAVAGEKYTAFTGAFLDALHGSSAPRELEDAVPLEWIYAKVAREARKTGLPVPSRVSTGSSGQLALTRAFLRPSG